MALVYMEVAQRCKFPMVGLNMPAHFMITPLVRCLPRSLHKPGPWCAS